jgi:hypothetical protein
LGVYEGVIEGWPLLSWIKSFLFLLPIIQQYSFFSPPIPNISDFSIKNDPQATFALVMRLVVARYFQRE